jgi:hypothetical protein
VGHDHADASLSRLSFTDHGVHRPGVAHRGLLVWLVLTSFGLARLQQQGIMRLQREAALLIADEIAQTTTMSKRTRRRRPHLPGYSWLGRNWPDWLTAPDSMCRSSPWRGPRANFGACVHGAARRSRKDDDGKRVIDRCSRLGRSVMLNTTRGSPAMAPFVPQFVLSLLLALLS